MSFIKAHIFKTFKEAQEAIELINKGEGIPINEQATTRTYTQAQENEGNIYISADSVTEKYLGKPIDLKLKEFEI